MLAANAIGTAGSCSCRRRRPSRRARELSGLVGRRLMMHPFANVDRPVRRGPRELAGALRLLDRVIRVLRDRRAPGVRARREVGPRAHRRADQRRPAEPGGRTGLGRRPPPPRALPPRPRRQLGPVRRGPPRRSEPVSLSRRSTDSIGVCRPQAALPGCRTTRGGCSTSTSTRHRSHCSKPAPTRSRSIG